MAFFPFRATGRALFPCTPDLIYEALADYDAWQEWTPSVASSKLLMREDILAIVELGMGAGGEETLLTECIQTPGRSVVARAIEGKGPIRAIEWNIEPADGGFSKVTVALKPRIGLHLFNPANWRIVSPAKYLAALRATVLAANPGPEEVRGGENLFELWETEAGLVCWIRGRKYKLTRVEDGQP